jgi:UDP-GlcNAc:undecaprenyl-phosphate GlcNAc-1-phosphate transferase
VNFIDGLDGLAAGIVAIAACAFLVYSYTLARVIGIHSQSVPTLIAALLAGVCIGFLPHNFHPARIFMGDTGSMLIGLLLAYVPLSSTATLDPNVLTHYNTAAVNRYPTVLPLLVPVAILIIPYADLLLAVVRRTRAGMSPFAPDKKHLHHRLLSVGHSHRQSVLIIYMWAALFTGVVTSLSLVRTDLIVLVGLTLVAVLALLPVTMPRLRPSHWRQSARADRAARTDRAARASRAAASQTVASPGARPASRAPAPALADPALANTALADTAAPGTAPAGTVPLNADGPSRPDLTPTAPRERTPATPARPATPQG